MECALNIDHFTDNSTYVSRHLMVYGAVHNYIVFALGVVLNGVALWCIRKCTKTNAAMKLLMMSVFAALFVICLFTRLVMAEALIGQIYCDPMRPKPTVLLGFSLLYALFAQFELAAIAVVAVFRTAAVWASNAYVLRMRVAVAAVITIFIYSFLTAVFLLGAMFVGYIKAPVLDIVNGVYFFLNTLLPIFTTMTCYVAMIIAMRRNKRRMAQVQSSHSRVVNNATRGMMAVFASNLIFGVPHSIYHLMPRPSQSFGIIFHVLFSTHFIVDPLVFIYFNHSYRRRVCERLWAGWAWVAGKCGGPAPTTPRPLGSSTTTSLDVKMGAREKHQHAGQVV
ncbi:uncharacterized protein LOC122266545 [Penaeus japonicus]|uniref:uncharacterized protein LOC122266545 n=1 Tax=Penaeus japonicus TaxID=27405 RepID=UPI001C70FCCF|nr:uncharacterized protein LOC122266545 [Penaeus japonicus]